jgi:ActD protein
MADDPKDKSKPESREIGDRRVYPSLRDPESVAAHNRLPPQAPGHRRHEPVLYGVMAEFEGPNELVHAARRTYEAGYRRINGYSPYPIEELSEAIGFTHSALPLIVFIGGLIGCLGGFFMQYWIEVINYPINVGGKPFNSWPAFIPITFECTVLVAAFSAVLGMLFLNKLPQPYHPVFNAPNFALATRDRFFLVVEANDPEYNHDTVMQLLQSLNATEVIDVEV